MKGTSKMGSLRRKSKGYLKQSSPAILTCIGAIGVVATSVMAVKATPKALSLIDDELCNRATKLVSGETHNLSIENLSMVETIQLIWRCYIPAALVGLSTITCIFGANVLNKRNQASLVSAYSLLNQSYQRYRKAANTVYGEDADAQIKAQAAKDIYVSADGYSTYSPDLDKASEKVLFHDVYSQRYFTSTMASVLNAQYHLNRNLQLRGEVSINEFYEFLGIDKIESGDLVGWSMDNLIEGGIMWLDFENAYVKMEDGMECYIISTLFDPTAFEYEV